VVVSRQVRGKTLEEKSKETCVVWGYVGGRGGWGTRNGKEHRMVWIGTSQSYPTAAVQDKREMTSPIPYHSNGMAA